MTLLQELSSWNPFAASHTTHPVPNLGEHAPSIGQLQFPRTDKKPTIITFLRHCGCPFAEKTFKNLKAAAKSNPDIHFIAVSHSDQEATTHWLKSVDGAGSVDILVDSQRELYGMYGLGLSSFWHTLNPWSMASVLRLGRSEQIWNRPTESGSRWQTAGMFGVNSKGLLEYVHIARAADDLGNLDEALAELKR